MTALALPGITFETVASPPTDFLPRMDVCGFVGFASSGPINVPVLVEDPIRFRDVFGPDPIVARTTEGLNVLAHLGSAVEAFFANGGVRAWVVRLAATTGADQAVRNTFTVPGLITPGVADGSAVGWSLGAVHARAAGSWSDGLRVGARLNVDAGVAVSVGDDSVVVPTSLTVAEHDVVRLLLDDGRSVMTSIDSLQRSDQGMVLEFGTEELASWMVDTNVDFDALAAADFVADERPVTLLGHEASTVLESVVVEVLSPPADADLDAVTLVLGPAAGVAAGHVIAIDAGAGAGPLTLVWVGDQVFPPEAPDDGNDRYSVRHALTIAALAADWTAHETVPDSVVVERLRVDLLVHEGEHLVSTLANMSTNPAHTRAMASLPTDETLFAHLANVPRTHQGDVSIANFQDRDLTPLETSVVEPRFPLADSDASLLLPLLLSTTADQMTIGPAPDIAALVDAPIRNGLADFSAGLFVDPQLADMGTNQITEAAFALAYVGNNPRPLQGMHALLPLDEVTMIALPDAVHTGWDRIEVVPPPPLTAPLLQQPETGGSDAEPHVDLTWSAVDGAESYELFDSPIVEMTDPTRHETTELELRIHELPACAQARFYRVRALRDLEIGPWSNMTAAHVPADDFAPCEPPEIPPELLVGEPTAEQDPSTVAWRARTAVIAEPWNDLRAIHAAALRWSAARGDVFALLDLPISFTANQSASYVQTLAGTASEFDTSGMEAEPAFLAAGVPRLNSSEQGLSRLTAIYHPWLVSGFADDDLGTRRHPPAGAMAGVYAHRTLERGAWIAPANQPLKQITGLSPNLSDADRLVLLQASINPIGPDPRGFLPLSARTASAAKGTRQVNVRRLLQLIRRLAIREGMTDVFRPNDQEFRQLVRMRFERLLTGMHARGAFFGATTAEAFEVSTGDAVNPEGLVDLGRFVVEIRIAPSRPLEFMTVRLVLSGSTGPSIEAV